MILRNVDIRTYSTLSAPHTGVFGSERWLSIYNQEQLRVIGIFRDEHQMIGGFYYLRTSRLGIDIVRLPPYSPHCGLFFIPSGTNRSTLNTQVKEVMTAVADYFSGLRTGLTVLAFPSQITDLQPFIWQKYKVVPNYTYRVNLKRNDAEITSDFSSKTRNAISKAIKDGVTVEKNAMTAAEMYAFFSDTLKAAGANVYNAELKNLFHVFAAAGNSFCLQASLNGARQGAVFCAYDGQVCYYLLGGVIRSGAQGINNLLIQKSMEEARALGCSTFDFEGSMIPGVEKFFRSFGGELLPYYTANKALLPVEMILKLKKREIF